MTLNCLYFYIRSMYNCKYIFRCLLLWGYVRQPDDHLGWATLMPFASIYSTNPRTNPWNFCEKILRIGREKKDSVPLSRPFWFFFKKKKFVSSPWKSVTNFVVEWMELIFYDYDGLQPKTTPPKNISRQCSMHHIFTRIWWELDLKRKTSFLLLIRNPGRWGIKVVVNVCCGCPLIMACGYA